MSRGHAQPTTTTSAATRSQLPRRNIFAPPAATSTPPVSQAGGVFGSAAKCAPADATDVYRSDAAGRNASARPLGRFGSPLWSPRRSQPSRLSRSQREVPTTRCIHHRHGGRCTPHRPHSEVSSRGSRVRQRAARRVRGARTARARAGTTGLRDAAPRRASPSPHSPPRPAPAPAGPRAEPQGPASTVRPARVPPDSPPEFM